MRRSPHLLLALTGHGYGHLAQSAPVVNHLRASHPDLELTVMSALPHVVLAAHLDGAFQHLATESGPVMQMHNAWEVDVPATQRAFGEYHRCWDAGLQNEVEQLRAIAPDLVLANIPYRLLLAARQLDIPAIALGSLNWADVYAAYCGSEEGSSAVLAQMRSGYRTADTFLAPEPALPMGWLENRQAIGPIARSGGSRREEILGRLAAGDVAGIILVALGGIRSVLPAAHWPRIPGTVWLFDHDPGGSRADMIDMTGLSLSFIDALASADAVLTKPGYGTYAEAICNGIAILTLERPDWPETPCLNAWAAGHGRLEEISTQQFQTGAFAAAVERLLAQPRPPRCLQPQGAEQAAGVLANSLQQCR